MDLVSCKICAYFLRGIKFVQRGQHETSGFKTFFLQYMRTPMMRRVSGELKS